MHAQRVAKEKKFLHTEKKNSCKENVNETKFAQLENSPAPHNFSNGPSLKQI